MGSPIASIPVEITGDFSDLDAALQQSIIAAELGGSKIAAAFTSAVAPAQQLDDIVKLFSNDGIEFANNAKLDADSLRAMGDAANAAIHPVTDLGTALSDWVNDAGVKGQMDALNDALKDFADTSGTQIKPAVQEATASTIGWSDALKLLGVDLSARAIKDFIVDTLESFAAIEKATVAITALTGDVGQANAAITGLEQLALADALSFPSLLTAEQRMLAFGFTAQDIPGAMQAIADAAAATGRSFDTVANMFERVVESGTVSTRTLVNLGISTADLGKALGTTADNAAKAFKALDETDRVAALESAMRKFDGTAQQVAQTLSGQWQILSTQFQLELQKMGAAFAPLAEVLIHTLSTVAIPAFDGAVQYVQRLSSALTDLAAIAAQPINIVVNLTNQVFGLKNTFKDLVDGPLGQFITLPLNAPLVAIEGLTKGYQTFTGTGPQIDAMQQMIIDRLGKSQKAATDNAGGLKAAEDASRGMTTATADLITKQEDLDMKAINAYDVWKQTAELQKQGKASLEDVTRAHADYQKALDASTPKTKDFADTLDGVNKKYTDYVTAANTAKATFDKLQAGYQDGKVPLQEYVIALNNLIKSWGDAYGPAHNYELEIAQISAKHQEGLNTLASAQQAFDLISASWQNGQIKADTYRSALENLKKAWDAVNVAGTNSNIIFAEAIQKQTNLENAAEAQAKAWNKAVEQWDKSQIDWAALVRIGDDLIKAMNAAGLSAGDLDTNLTLVGGTFPVIAGGITKLRTGDSDIDALNQKMIDLGANTGVFSTQAATFASSASDAAKGVRIYGDDVASANDEITSLYEDQPIATDAVKAGSDAYAGMKVQTGGLVTGLKDLDGATAEYTIRLGKVTQEMKDAIAATKEWHSGVKDFTPDMMTFASIIGETGDAAVTAAEKGIDSLNSWDKALNKLADDWKSFQDSFANDPTTGAAGGGGGGRGRSKGGNYTFLDLANSSFNRQFNSGFTLPPHTHLDYSLWGISGARVVPDLGYVVDGFGNIVPDPYLAGGPQFGANTPNIGDTTARAAGSSSPAAATAQAATTAVNLAATNDQLSTLSTNVAALNTTVADASQNISGSFAELSPVIQQATTQIAASVQQQSASFKSLTEVLAPITAPAPVGPPASFSRTGQTPLTSGPVTYGTQTTVNNLQITTTPVISDLLNRLTIELQRQGVRF